jgi:chorismate-pyruvate lyase
LDEVRGIQSQLERDIPAGRVTNNVCPRNAEMLHQESAVRHLLREAHRTCNTGAAGTAHTVVMHEAIPADESRLLQQRREPIGEDAGMNEHHRLAVSTELVVKLNAVEYRPIHLNPRRACRG